MMKNIFVVLPIIAMFGASSGFATRYKSDDESDDGREVGLVVSPESAIRYESGDESDDGDADSGIDSGGGDTSVPNSPRKLAKGESSGNQESTSSSLFLKFSPVFSPESAQTITSFAIIGKDKSGDLPSPSEAPKPLAFREGEWGGRGPGGYCSPLLEAKKRIAPQRAGQESRDVQDCYDVASIMQRYSDSKVSGSDSEDCSDSDSEDYSDSD